MSNDAAIIAAALLPSMGKCRVCGCGGDSCSLPWGEKCCWVDELRTLCNNPACRTAAALKKKDVERDRKRAAAKVSPVPLWLRNRRAEQRKHKQKKAKGRAA